MRRSSTITKTRGSHGVDAAEDECFWLKMKGYWRWYWGMLRDLELYQLTGNASHQKNTRSDNQIIRLETLRVALTRFIAVDATQGLYRYFLKITNPASKILPLPIGSMYGIFTCVYEKNQPNVGKYTIHGWYGVCSISSPTFSIVQWSSLDVKLGLRTA